MRSYKSLLLLVFTGITAIFFGIAAEIHEKQAISTCMAEVRSAADTSLQEPESAVVKYSTMAKTKHGLRFVKKLFREWDKEIERHPEMATKSALFERYILAHVLLLSSKISKREQHLLLRLEHAKSDWANRVNMDQLSME